MFAQSVAHFAPDRTVLSVPPQSQRAYNRQIILTEIEQKNLKISENHYEMSLLEEKGSKKHVCFCIAKQKK